MELKAKGSTSIKALLVEDIGVCRLVLSTFLLRLHCEVTLAMNGKEAVDLFLEGEYFDIVLFDNNMPIMTGPEVLNSISLYMQVFDMYLYKYSPLIYKK